MALVFLLLVLSTFTAADEGFWLFNKPPVQAIRQRYGFTVSPQYLNHFQLSSTYAVRQSNDSMIKLALFLEPITKALRSRYEKEYLAVEEKNAGLIMKAWRKYYGKTAPPPDANGFLRLSFGTVKGWTDPAGKRMAFWATYGDLYRKAESSGNGTPYKLSPRFLERKSSVDLRVGLNFVTTADAFGGNSGSPCVKAEGKLVGLLFDINPAALANRLGYDGTRARSILVDS